MNGSWKVALAALATAVGTSGGLAAAADAPPSFRWADGRAGSSAAATPRDVEGVPDGGRDVTPNPFARDPQWDGDRALFLQSSGVAATAAPTPTRRPLMNLLDQAGLARPLDDAKIKVFGYVEGSYTKNLSGGEPIAAGFDRFNPGRLFDFEPEDPTLNQVALSVERTVAYRNAKAFDVGFRIDTVYGSDARFIHANGLDFYNDPQPILDFGADEQFDLYQAYADLAVPVGNGLRVRLGKFAYFKTIDPNVSPFYSRSFSYNPQALPFTLTGGLASYAVDNKLLLEGGVVRGWDQALKDNNGSVSFVAGALYQFNPADPRTPFVYAKGITGPEVEDNTGAYRTVVDVVFGFSPIDGLNLFVDALYGQGSFTTATEDARWYGAAGYALYKVNDLVTVNGRLEWYRDEDGATLGAAASFYAATLGVTITPFPKDLFANGIKIRPEVRYDYATTGNFNGDHDQVTVAIDAIVNF